MLTNLNNYNPPLVHKITNLNIVEKFDKNGNPYYLFFDNDVKEPRGNLYLGFISSHNTADGKNWELIIKNYRDIKEIEFEYSENPKGRRIEKLLNVSLVDYN